ncbi:MAG: pilus assembly protein PilM [Patescibacteria group bacterium]|jgi:type IV pilus assembly protein PilM|nr:pilus assembly protein PilM [Patescibacteria group bacterium]
MFNKQIFGLDISDHSVELVLLEKPLFGKVKAVAYSRLVLRGNLISNGVIKDKLKLSESLTKLLESAKPRSVRTRYCVVSLPDSQVFTTVFKFPAGLRHSEIQKTIPFKAEEAIPFKASEVYFDFKTISVQGSSQDVFYVAAPIKIVDDYIDLLSSAGLKPIAFDLESISLARAVIGQTVQKDQATLLVDIGSRTTSVNIFDQNGIRQNLVIKTGGNRFAKALATKLKMTVKDAEVLKIKNGFDQKKQSAKALAILQKEAEKIILEINSLIDYYQTQTQRQVGSIILVGGCSLMPAIDQYLANTLQREVNLGQPLMMVADRQQLLKLKDRAVFFANAIGLALRGLARDAGGSDINLLPMLSPAKFAFFPKSHDLKVRRRFKIRLVVLVVLLAILITLVILKQRGFDLYSKVMPTYDYETYSSSDIELDILNELRQELLNADTTTTPTVMPPVVKVKIKPTSVGFLNVREGAGTDFAKVGQADSGAEYQFLEEIDGWYKITLDDGLAGWVSATFAELLEEPAVSAGNASSTPEVLGVSNEDSLIIKISPTELGYLNVRRRPDIGSDKIGQAAAGEEFEVSAQVDGWYQITLTDGNQGWVSSVYAKEIN